MMNDTIAQTQKKIQTRVRPHRCVITYREQMLTHRADVNT